MRYYYLIIYINWLIKFLNQDIMEVGLCHKIKKNNQ